MERKVLRSMVLCSMVGLLFAFVGCSKSNPFIAPDENQTDNGFPRPAATGESNELVWGRYTIAISEDHTNAELVPVRNSSLHLNVTKFVEGSPCPDCLTISKPIPQADGTFKLHVWLSHPFPNSPEYTGFDVRGILIFTATDSFYHHEGVINPIHSGYLMETLQLNYSDPAKGGGALLNPDGYTFYLNPLIEYPYPDILNYSAGEKSIGEPDCTVNPYILFSDGSPRRMFKTSDFHSRIYHIKPPDAPGAFEIGYVVSACWAPPVNTPVTKPDQDFPVAANCEDPWDITIVQLQPISYEVFELPLFKVTLKHRPGTLPRGSGILTPTISTSPDYPTLFPVIRNSVPHGPPEHVEYVDDETTELILRIPLCYKDDIGNELVPGWHLGMFFTYADCEGDPPPSQFWQPLGVHPVMVYVEV